MPNSKTQFLLECVCFVAEKEWKFVRQFVRVVKEVDLKSTGLCPRMFESCSCRLFCMFVLGGREGEGD